MKVTSLVDYVGAATKLASSSPLVWFRGLRRHTHQLVPSLYRLGDTTWSPDQYLDLEDTLINRFRERSMPYRTREAPSNELEFLFEMQHYGAPTRLLDWSENALIALWFALEVDSPFRARVWALDASKWNHSVLPSRQDVASALSPTHDAVKGLLPWQVARRTLIMNPLCIYGLHNSTRIVGQRGVFTLAGTSSESMEQQAELLAQGQGLKRSELLVNIDLPAGSKQAIRKELVDLGFSRSMIYPDLVGLAQELAERAREGSL